MTLQDSDVRRLGISAVLLHHLTDEHEWPPPIQYYELNRAWNNRRGWQYSPVNTVKEKRPIHTESLKKLIFMCHLTNNFSIWVERLLWRSTILDKSLATLNSYLLNQEGNCTASKNLGLIRDISRGLLCAPIFMKLNDNGLIVVLFETRSHVD
ncbi:hypothetical protein MAR_038239 [Mya arenaria]|uniref:Uncharacterized protein n=1 Tax=Mya arenaria TaxID=6604 RepID=A0ABY7FRB0_MYAAR|nr:hypothetical protein MAR_038239 [Mya arenaria]